MKRILIALVYTVVAMSAMGDELWQRAVSLYDTNTGWIAGSTRQVTEMFDRQGNLKSSEIRNMVSAWDEGAVRTDILFAEKNGKNITEEEQKKAVEERRKAQSQTGDARENQGVATLPNPFDPDSQDSITYTNVDSIYRDGFHLVRYEFRMDSGDQSAFTGTALVDADSGVAVEIDATMEPLPRFTKFVRLFAQFNNDPERWFPTHIEFEGAGGWFLIYRHFKSTMSFSEYFRPEDEN